MLGFAKTQTNRAMISTRHSFRVTLPKMIHHASLLTMEKGQQRQLRTMSLEAAEKDPQHENL